MKIKFVHFIIFKIILVIVFKFIQKITAVVDQGYSLGSNAQLKPIAKISRHFA